MQTLVENHFTKCTLAAPGRILVATDLTDTDFLVPHAIAQAKASGDRVTMIHALPPTDLVPMNEAAIPYVDKTKIVRDARLMLLGVAHQFESQGISCDTAVHEGSPTEVIPEEISRANTTRLIMGSHGRGKLGQLALGSVAHGLITNVNVPVFVIGPHARLGVQHATPRKILHPVSLMGDYRETLHLALHVAQTYKAELTLLHVLDRDLMESVNPKRTMEWAENALDVLVPDATGIPPVHTMVTSGGLAEEILKAAGQIGTDWIVLGANGGVQNRPFVQSAAYRVLAAATCPVLTLRHAPRPVQAMNLEEVHFTSPL